MRRCTHVSPLFKHSSHPSAEGVTLRIVGRCVHFIKRPVVAGSFCNRHYCADCAARGEQNVNARDVKNALAWRGHRRDGMMRAGLFYSETESGNMGEAQGKCGWGVAGLGWVAGDFIVPA